MAELDRATRVKRELFLRELMPTRPTPAVARQLVRMMSERHIEAGAAIYRHGEEADEIFFLVEGEVELVDPAGVDTTWRFGPGDVIGILDVNIERPRSRDATAIGPVELLSVRRDDWLEFYGDNLEYGARVRAVQGVALHGLREALGPGGGFEPRSVTAEQALEAAAVQGTLVERLVALRECPLLQTAGVQALVELADRSEIVRAARGELALRPGGAGSSLYVVLAGVVEAERRIAPVIRASFGHGELVLGGAAFGGGLDGYAVLALSDVVLLRFTTSDLDDVSEDHFDVVRALHRGLALEREQLMRTRAQREGDGAPTLVPATQPPQPR